MSLLELIQLPVKGTLALGVDIQNFPGAKSCGTHPHCTQQLHVPIYRDNVNQSSELGHDNVAEVHTRANMKMFWSTLCGNVEQKLCLKSRKSFVDRVSTGSGSDLVSDQHAIFPNDPFELPGQLPSPAREL